MEFEPLDIPGAFVIHLDLLRDDRGVFARTYCADEFARAGIDFVPVQGNLSRNVAEGTLRGLHFQRPPHEEAKLVQCVAGALFDAIVDLRRDSPTFGRSASVTLDADSGRLLFIPPGCAHGFLTTEPGTDILYAMGSRFVDGAGRGIRWDDPALDIPWPGRPLVISDRDATYPLLAEIDPELLS
ncbi:dTDP-4-dehydrorhamnose 3,5-epimerase family protein [Nocardioides pelophilus]|uniref:dTDP-4-dehydrorhamnose 3,5-epimerase family protein n=1 Tax=Nocardioides pelophilus TaxID=2172019 RepID=UPI0016000562|nr:dTDP-4-dehydrorhamnose 3,5-epimerase family protein [Nocardioides pelophilus]